MISVEESTTIKKLMDHQGYCVVNIPSIDLDQLKKLFIEDLSVISGKPLHDLWTLKSGIDYPVPAMVGLLGEYGLSQGEAAWMIRTNKEIQKVFADLLNSTELVVSSDAIGFSTDSDKVTNRQWLHVDQNPNIHGSDINSIQGIFYAETSNEFTATTALVPNSHEDWHDHDYSSSSHFQLVDQQKYWGKTVRICIPAGCLLIYTSKLVHQGWHGPHRLCFMVSYGLKEDRSENVRERKIMMYLGGQRSTHWSQFGQIHGRKWRQGEQWYILPPKLTDVANWNIVKYMLSSNFLEQYHTDFDKYIPTDRLNLL